MLITNCGVEKDFWGRYKNLLIIGGGILQHETLVQCGSMGLGKILLDENPDCYCARSPYFNNDYFIKASTREPELAYKEVKKFLSKHKKIKVVGVYTQGCDAEYTVAYIADKLGLPCIGVDVAFKCNNKIAMREAFEKAEIPQPKFSVNSADNLTYPIVVKAVDNCASRGLTIVRDSVELEKAIPIALNNSIDKRVLLEEFIDGQEYSIDTIVYKGRVYPAGISDRVFIPKENYAVQDGSLTPSLLPENTQDAMYRLMQRCADAVGLKWGAFKGDLIIDKNGYIFPLEITARLSGGFDAQFRKPYSYGVNLIKATIDMACGKPMDFRDIIPKWVKFSQTFSIFPKPGVIKKIEGIEKVRNLPGIKQVFVTKHVGQFVEYKSCADRFIYIVACADTYEHLQEVIRQAREMIKVTTE